mmetsp:Transcript_77863/g.178217  ORF Transcript_77863/g.178217 Transcript_77863/m.178217 type:complete len:196 (+) Transcript_77863:29-616(+)
MERKSRARVSSVGLPPVVSPKSREGSIRKAPSRSATQSQFGPDDVSEGGSRFCGLQRELYMKLKEAFIACDRDQDGLLGFSEVVDAGKHAGVCAGPPQWRLALEEHDDRPNFYMEVQSREDVKVLLAALRRSQDTFVLADVLVPPSGRPSTGPEIPAAGDLEARAGWAPPYIGLVRRSDFASAILLRCQRLAEEG